MQVPAHAWGVLPVCIDAIWKCYIRTVATKDVANETTVGDMICKRHAGKSRRGGSLACVLIIHKKEAEARGTPGARAVCHHAR